VICPWGADVNPEIEIGRIETAGENGGARAPSAFRVIDQPYPVFFVDAPSTIRDTQEVHVDINIEPLDFVGQFLQCPVGDGGR
jgi:hypothetical protein